MGKFDGISFYGQENEELQKEYEKMFHTMTNEEKQLLLKDLCARLPYGVIVHEEWDYQNPGVKERTKKEEDRIMNCYDLVSIETIRPYLRPMSSMDEIERGFFRLVSSHQTVPDGFGSDVEMYSLKCIDWLITHHFDYLGLIPMGLAIEVTEENNLYK